jgi:hypothetical protein
MNNYQDNGGVCVCPVGYSDWGTGTCSRKPPDHNEREHAWYLTNNVVIVQNAKPIASSVRRRQRALLVLPRISFLTVHAFALPIMSALRKAVLVMHVCRLC